MAAGRGAGSERAVARVAGLSPPLSSDPETERYRLFDAVAAWLATVSADQPLLLVLDDPPLAALDRQPSTPVPFDLYWLLTMTNWAAVAAHLGATAHAERLATTLCPYAEQAIPLIGMPTPSVAHHLGLLATTLGRYDEAEMWFAAAAATHERLGAPHRLARTHLEQARMLLARRAAGDAGRARELLGRALHTARELGLADVDRRTVALLR